MATNHGTGTSPRIRSIIMSDVTFSDPGLIWTGLAEEDTTVGALKEANGLVCQYSAELSEEEIAEINAAELTAGEWVLISLRPFDTEEILTLTLTDGRELTTSMFNETVAQDGDKFYIGKRDEIPYGFTELTKQ